MDRIISAIDKDIKFITENTDNAFILKSCDIMNTKMNYIKERTYSTQDTINNICDKIINYDIHNIKNVPELPENIYAKANDLAIQVEKIKTVYFE